ncbi:MAG TPA: alanine--tRNA ligase, partial [Candidatus Pacearchaeota archaeon]|nr:alanine--tRNA ligase [Candidatus Pacearchaeota archaeon]
RSIHKNISGKEAFLLYQSYGFPIEMIRDVAIETGTDVDIEAFNQELKKHQELSRTASVGKFKSGLADNSEATTKLHTAAHLLNEALREVLNDKEISQRGSNITPERLRFDFNFDRKLTDEEKQKVEKLINEKISESLSVELQEMSTEEAKESGAHGMFDDKYGDKVKVYKIGDFSNEICAGPHVKNISELGIFKIKKEQSSSAGVRRIKAVLE